MSNPLDVPGLLVKWPERCGARCGECPLRHQVAVPAEAAFAVEWPERQQGKRVYVIGEGPGKVEAARGRPFMGETGYFFNEMLRRYGIERGTWHISNAMLCTPLTHTSSAQFNAALDACRPRLVNELAEIPPGSLIFAMGSKAFQTLCGKSSVKDWGGYPHPARAEFQFLNDRKVLIMPIWHPAYILRTPAYLPVWREWFERGLAMMRGEIPYPWTWAPLHIDLDEKMLASLERMRRADWVGADIEMAGEDSYSADLLCIGLGVAQGDGEMEEAVSVPWPQPEGSDYSKLIKEIGANARVRKVFQNGSVDLISLRTWRMPFSANDFDSLIAHRILAPQIAHDLGFIAANFFPAPRWKAEHKVGDDRKGSDRWKVARGDTLRYHALREYNAKDALMTAKLRRPMWDMLQNFERGMRRG